MFMKRRLTFFNPNVIDKVHVGKTEFSSEPVVSEMFALVDDGNIGAIKKAMTEENTTLLVKNENGECLTHVAIKSESVAKMHETERYKLIKFLIDNGAPVTAFDKNNVTPLHFAAKAGYSDIVKLLLSKNSDPNSKSNQGMTPLHFAVLADVVPCDDSTQLQEVKDNSDGGLDISKEFAPLAVIVAEIINSKTLSFAIVEIRNQIRDSDKIFSKEFEIDRNKYVTHFEKLLSNPKLSEEERRMILSEQISGLEERIKSLLTMKLFRGTTELEIAPSSGGGPFDDPKKNVMPKRDVGRMLDKAIREKSDLLKKKHAMQKISSELKPIMDTIGILHEHCKEIIDHNYNLVKNEDALRTGGQSRVMQRGEFSVDHLLLMDDILAGDTSANFVLPDISSNQRCAMDLDKHTLPSYTSIGDFTHPRGTKSAVRNWRRSGLYYDNFRLTDDKGHPAIGRHAEEIFHNAEVAVGLGFRFDLDLLDVSLKVPYGTNHFSIFSKLICHLVRLDRLVKVIAINFSALMEHMYYKYYGHVPSVIIPTLVINIIDAVQNLSEIRKEKQLITRKLFDLKSEYLRKIDEFHYHPYIWSMERIVDVVDEVERVTAPIDCSSFYKELIKIHETFDVCIDVINATTVKNITEFDPMDGFEDGWSTMIARIPKLPPSLQQYINETSPPDLVVDLETGEGVREMKDAIVKKYLPIVDTHNFPSYVFDPGNEGRCLGELGDDIPCELAELDESSRFFMRRLNYPSTATPMAGYSSRWDDESGELLHSGYGRDDDYQEVLVNGTILLSNTGNNQGRFGAISSRDYDQTTLFIGEAIGEHIKSLKCATIFVALRVFDKPAEQEDGVKMLNRELVDRINNVGDFGVEKPVLLSIVGKMADKLVNNFIGHEIAEVAKNLSHKYLTGEERDVIATPPLVQHIFGPKSSPFVELMSDGSKLILETETNKKQPQRDSFHVVYNDGWPACHTTSISTVRALLKGGSDANAKDSAGMSPVCSAIRQLNHEVVSMFMRHGAHVRLKNGISPLDYLVVSYKDYVSLLYSYNEEGSISSSFIENLVTDISTSLLTKFGKRFAKTRLYFAQILIMVGNLFYDDMKAHTRSWSSEDNRKISTLLKQIGIGNEDVTIPILEVNYNEAMEVFFDERGIVSFGGDIVRLEELLSDRLDKIKELKSKQQSYIKEMNKTTDTVVNIFYKRHFENSKDLITSLRKDVKQIEGKLKGFDHSQKADSHARITTFFAESKDKKKIVELHSQSTIDFYNEVFNLTSNGDRENKYTGKENYTAYNKLWEIYLASEVKIESKHNIHLLLTLLELDLLRNADGDVGNFFEVVGVAYEKIIIPFVSDYFHLSDKDTTENAALFKIVKIVEHTTRHVVCADLYLSVVKIVVKHISNQIRKDLTEKQRTDEILKGVDNFVTRSKIAGYIIGELPKLITLNTLEIISEGSTESLLEVIVKKVRDNTYGNNEDAVSGTEELLLFYGEVLTLLLLGQKAMVNDYFGRLVNQSKYVKMASEIL